jgi:hypothetical protein
MPLLDHFHQPVQDQLARESLHAGWTTRLADALNERWLSNRFLAAERRHVGPHVEIDVATLERPSVAMPPSGNGGGVATLPQTWAPPLAVCSVPLVFPDCFEIRVFEGTGGWYLVGAIELISPGNKDRPDERRAFATKCAAYLHQGVSVVIIDVVTARRANLHNDIVRLVNVTDERAFLPDDVALYAAAYRPVLRDGQPGCDVWRQPCAVGQPLPTMPLRLTGDLFVPVEFEATYTETCQRRRIHG